MKMSSKQNVHSRQLLRALLSPLVKEWGVREVEDALHDIYRARQHLADTRPSTDEERGPDYHHTVKRSKRPTAVEIVQRLKIPEERRPLLLTLATQFDHKTFLPSIGDVKHFLEMHGHGTDAIRQRPDAFRRVISILLNMSHESLSKWIERGAHSGPSQLGPLSDAIRTSSEAIRQHSLPVLDDGSSDKPNPRAESADEKNSDSSSD